MAEISTTTQFVTLDDIRAAAERIKPLARVTPLVDVSEAAHRALFLKCATHRRDTKTSVGSIIEDPEQIAQSDGMLNLAQYCSTIFITSACR